MQITIPDNLVVSELTAQITNAVFNSLDDRIIQVEISKTPLQKSNEE